MEEAFGCIIGVKLGVGVAVVSTMTTTPPLDGTLNGTCTGRRQYILESRTRVIRAVSPQTVVASSNAKAGDKVVENGEKECLPAKGREESTNEANSGGDGEDNGAEPIDFLVPIFPLYRREGLLGLQGVGDIVIWDVEVGGDDVVKGRGRLGGSGGRHGGRRGERRGQEKEGQTDENIWQRRFLYDLMFVSLGIAPQQYPPPTSFLFFSVYSLRHLADPKNHSVRPRTLQGPSRPPRRHSRPR